MPPKQRRSFSIDEDIHEWIRGRAEFNASAAVNRYLRDRMDGLTHNEAVLRAEERRLEEDLESREAELEAVQDRLEATKQELSRVTSLREQAAEEDHSDAFTNMVAEVAHLIENGQIDAGPEYADAVEAMRDPSSQPATIVNTKLSKVPDVNDRDVFLDAVETELDGDVT